MNKRERAKDLVLKYVKTIYLLNDRGWNPDRVTEIEKLVDLLIDAAKEEIQAEQETNLHAEYKQRYNL